MKNTWKPMTEPANDYYFNMMTAPYHTIQESTSRNHGDDSNSSLVTDRRHSRKGKHNSSYIVSSSSAERCMVFFPVGFRPVGLKLAARWSLSEANLFFQSR
ncbi:uncharacterized protein LOC111291406 isoform X2 [Durio zibethinus]|uniref:Uncharacterized protein LOC111291406 isoform X2 n=1 Tax=Durio zibethinus TaxID=66656 RepID=A0A6P5YEJ1_DURZI|nr:uncharacterized protein LOC111291406 isoform X2 [Durio zibethinus]XP_022738853.1 uncharacterized protein LOC111291406 isoform X2 [Durio zibethinus]XP_022738854.1 uncharacterized protein LOC111291406 isoform X2 [Durio zibethinus]